MNLPLLFDTHAYVKRLRAAGFTEAQAEVQAEGLAKLIDNNLATKGDLERLDRDIAVKLKELEHRLTIRLGAMLAVAVGVVAAPVWLL